MSTTLYADELRVKLELLSESPEAARRLKEELENMCRGGRCSKAIPTVARRAPPPPQPQRLGDPLRGE